VHYDAEGHLTLEVIEQLRVPKQADFYLCGPTRFLEELTTKLKVWGVPESRIHTEVFGPGGSITPGIASTAPKAPHQPSGAAGLGPQVSFTRSGLVAHWDSRFGSLLEFAEACDVPIKWSCRTGVCHTCECALIGGDIRYDPEPLDRPAEGNALICCSKPLTAIELDL
jgi:ferredoxin